MHKFKKISLLIPGVIVGLLAWGASAQAMMFAAEDRNVINETEVVDGSYYAAGEKISIKGHVKGDVYCAGSTIDILGRVDGDILCAGQDITVDGQVDGSVRLAGQAITIGGQIKGGLSAAGANVSTGNNLRLSGDAVFLASSVALDGKLERDVMTAGSLVRLDGVVKRDFNLQGESLQIKERGQIKGDLDYTSSQSLDVDKRQIGGAVRHHKPSDKLKYSRSSIETVIASILLMIGAVVLYPLLVPQLAKKISQTGQKDMLYTVLIGVSALFGLPILAILVMFTGVGLPLGIVALLGLVIMMLLGLAQGAVWLGQVMLGKSTNNILLQSLGGALVLAIAVKLPVVGVVVVVAWLVVGLGLVARYTGKTLFQKPVYITKSNLKD